MNHYTSFCESDERQHVKQLTIRGLGDELTRAIRRLANHNGTSLNRAAIKLLRRGAGLDDGKGQDTVGSSLDHLIGMWSASETDEFERALKHFETIDKAMWE